MTNPDAEAPTVDTPAPHTSDSPPPAVGAPLFTIREDGPKGRGLFAASDAIPPGALLHAAPCLPIPAAEYERHLRHTVLAHYVFHDRRSGADGGGGNGNMLLALGYGSLFNHSRRPNVDYRVGADGTIRFYSSPYRRIRAGDELCISYGTDLWFDDASEAGDEDGSSSCRTEADDDSSVDGAAGFLERIELDDVPSEG